VVSVVLAAIVASIASGGARTYEPWLGNWHVVLGVAIGPIVGASVYTCAFQLLRRR
jgi:hypothetical protein